MTDTPEHVKKLQLETWLAKPPGERLRRFLIDNDALYRFWAVTKKQIAEKYAIQSKSSQ